VTRADAARHWRQSQPGRRRRRARLHPIEPVDRPIIDFARPPMRGSADSRHPRSASRMISGRSVRRPDFPGAELTSRMALSHRLTATTDQPAALPAPPWRYAQKKPGLAGPTKIAGLGSRSMQAHCWPPFSSGSCPASPPRSARWARPPSRSRSDRPRPCSSPPATSTSPSPARPAGSPSPPASSSASGSRPRRRSRPA
jgi:hypothetical protein